MYEELDKSLFKRKRNIVTICLALLVALAAGAFYIIEEAEEWREERRQERILRQRNRFFASLTLEQILYDFDYMICILEENYPFINLVYRNRGVSMHELAAEVRIKLESEFENLDADSFRALIFNEFALPMGFAGHLQPLSRDYYIGRLHNARITVHNPNAPDHPWHRFTYDIFMSYPSSSFYGDVTDANMVWAERRLLEPDNISTEIIEEGRIAYMRVSRMLMHVQGEDRTAVRQLFGELAEFEHFIIDIRGNPGGNYRSFHTLITSSIVDEVLVPAYWHFIKDSDLTLRYVVSAYRVGSFSPFTILDNGSIGWERTREPFIWGGKSFPYNFTQRQPDIEHIRPFSFLLWSTSLDKRRIYLSHAEGFPIDDFSGHIWLLIDERTASAAEHVASVYKSYGLATLVGETTAGIVGTPALYPVYFALPNSGMIIRYDPALVINSAGYILEEGIPPHIFNKPGMDALETVLYLIENKGAQ